MKKILLYLILIMAVGMAGIVAYVSVGGLLKVFSGAGTLGLLFFSAIEIAKIVATSAIHTYGKKISLIYKGLLSLGIGIAMLITSIGIYGFLSSTYKETFMKLESVEAQVSLLKKQRDGYQGQLDNFNKEKESINIRISDLSSGLSNNVIQYKDPETGQIITTTSSSTRRALEKQLNSAIERLDNVSGKSDELNGKVFELDNQITEVKLGNDSAAELGPLKYLSEVSGKSMDEVMKYFIFLLIIIGDPMAVLMVIIFNKIVKKDENDEDILPAGNKLPKEVKEVMNKRPSRFTKEEIEENLKEQRREHEEKRQLLGWEDCMRGKIVRHYGPEVEACVKSVTHGNWKDILKCIVDVKGITNPEVWIPEQLGLFAVWSAECIFVDPETGQVNVKYTEEEVYDEEKDTEDQELLDYAKVDDIIAKEYLEDEDTEEPLGWVSEEEVVEALQEEDVEAEDEEEYPEPNSNLLDAAERYNELTSEEEEKDNSKKITIDDIKEKRQERERGFSLQVPDRKSKHTVDRIGSNKEIRDGKSDTVYFKRRR